MADKLDEIFAQQRSLQDFLRQQRPHIHTNRTPHDEALELTRALFHEICELDDELEWKSWKNHQGVNREKLLFELVDIWLFLVQLTDVLDVTPEQLLDLYGRKCEENVRRQKEEPAYKP